MGTQSRAYKLASGILGGPRVQTLTIFGAPTGGWFTLTYGDQTTDKIAYDATGDEVESAIQALPNIGAGMARVQGNPGGPWTVVLHRAGPVAFNCTDSFTGSSSPKLDRADSMQWFMWVRTSLLTQTAVWIFRGVVGGVAFLTGIGLWFGVDLALGLSFGVLGLFILLHLGISWLWDMVTTPSTVLTLDPSGVYGATTALLAVPGIIVVLVGAYTHPSLAAKWGTVSLALSLLVGLVLFGLLVTELPQPTPSAKGSPTYYLVPGAPQSAPQPSAVQDQVAAQMSYFRNYFANTTLWLLAFGVLSITFGLVLPAGR